MTTRPLALTAAAAFVASLSLSSALPAVAFAAVERRGEWPESDPRVSLDVRGVSRAEAVRKLAEAARWSVVLHAPPGDPVDLRVTDEPAPKVLEMLLADGDYVAARDGAMVAITRAQPRAEPSQPSQPSPPPPQQGGDRKAVGHGLTIGKGEVVHDVTVRGGSLIIKGSVTGDVDFAGGSVTLQEGARVAGKVKVSGGSLHVGNDASIDGDVSVAGGSVHTADRAKLGGAVESRGGNVVSTALDKVEQERGEGAEPPSPLASAAKAVGDAMTRGALLFVLGTVLLALGHRRMETLRGAIATRPMRAFALGLVGSVGLGALLIALCVSVIGIPVAIIGALLAPVALFAGLSAVASVVGEALLRHRTDNPYVHLGGGCALLVLAGLVPYVGGWLTTFACLVGLGSVIATRAAGLIPARNRGRLDDGGYRDAAA